MQEAILETISKSIPFRKWTDNRPFFLVMFSYISAILKALFFLLKPTLKKNTLMSIFYFDEFEITHITNKEYRFTAKSEPDKPIDLRPVVDAADVGSARELKFDIADASKGQSYILDSVDFQNYARYDTLHIVLLKNGAIVGRDPKAQLVIRHTKYPPPDRAHPLVPVGSKGLNEPDLDNPRFFLTRITGKRTGDGIYSLSFKLRQTEASRKYIPLDYRAIYDENNFVVALALIIEEDTPGQPAEMDFVPSMGEEKNFDLATPVPVIVLEKTGPNYLDVDWTSVKTKVALLNFD